MSEIKLFLERKNFSSPLQGRCRRCFNNQTKRPMPIGRPDWPIGREGRQLRSRRNGSAPVVEYMPLARGEAVASRANVLNRRDACSVQPPRGKVIPASQVVLLSLADLRVTKVSRSLSYWAGVNGQLHSQQL